MQTITPNQIYIILDDYLNKYKSGKIKHANVLFIGETGIGKNAVIERRAIQIQFTIYNSKS